MQNGGENLASGRRVEHRVAGDTPLQALAAALEQLHDDLQRYEHEVTTRLDDVLAALESGVRPSSPLGHTGVVPPIRRWLARSRHQPVGKSAASTALSPEPVADSGRRTVVALCLRPFALFIDGMRVTSWNGPRSQAILRLLLTRHPTPVSRDVLTETFWPDVDPDAARRSMHQAVYRLRAWLRTVAGGDDLVSYELGAYHLPEDVDVWTDANEFERLVKAADDRTTVVDDDTAVALLSQAEYLYADDYMPDCPYDDWCRSRRDALRRMYVYVVVRLTDHATAQGDHGVVIALCQRLLERDPTNEYAYRGLMRSYLAAGHRHLAVAAFRECQDVLQRDLDVAPSSETTQLFDAATAMNPQRARG